MFWNRKKTPSTLSAPREHHYVFAHYTVREMCEQDPLKFFAIVASPEQSKFIAWLWDLTVKRVGKPIVEVNPAELTVTTGRVKEYPAIILKMPFPEAAAEVHLIAMLLTSGVPSNEASQPSFRYFTLEHGKNLDGTIRTVMCEWADGAHCNFGDGPSATVEAFIDAIEEKI